MYNNGLPARGPAVGASSLQSVPPRLDAHGTQLSCPGIASWGFLFRSPVGGPLLLGLRTKMAARRSRHKDGPLRVQDFGGGRTMYNLKAVTDYDYPTPKIYVVYTYIHALCACLCVRVCVCILCVYVCVYTYIFIYIGRGLGGLLYWDAAPDVLLSFASWSLNRQRCVEVHLS